MTPLNDDGIPDLNALPEYLAFLAKRGCHGALLLGTTGEGPSFSSAERRAIWKAGATIREQIPEFRLFAASGTPSLTETINLSKTAFELGYDAVVVLPPYYFRDAGEDGLFAWFSQVIEGAVPEDRHLLCYHNPAVSGVKMSMVLFRRLNEAYPKRFGGLKDSSGDLSHAKALAALLKDKLLLVGNDKLLSPALKAGASGCITSLANLISPQLRDIWEAHLRGEDTSALQDAVDSARSVLESHPPAQAFLKSLLHEEHGFPRWPVRPPLQDFNMQQTKQAIAALRQIAA